MTKLTYEYILRHDSDKPHCSDESREHRMRDIENIGYASSYAEPGYADPEAGILFGNWNHFSRRAADILKRAGYELEWQDEWSTCQDCGKAVRTSPDSYGWQAAFVILNDCELVCHECVDWADYLESVEDDSNKAVRSKCNPAEYGYKLLSGEYQNGLHPGQNDKPRDILKRLHADGRKRIVFRISDVGQFDVTFEAYEWTGTPEERLEHVKDVILECHASTDDADDRLWHGRRKALDILETLTNS